MFKCENLINFINIVYACEVFHRPGDYYKTEFRGK